MNTKFFNPAHAAQIAKTVVASVSTCVIAAKSIQNDANKTREYYNHGEIPPMKCIPGAGTYTPQRIRAEEAYTNIPGPK